MTAADRLVALESLEPLILCDRAEAALSSLVEIMNRETTLLRAGKMREAGALTADKTQMAQDYMMLARAVQRAVPQLKSEAPERTDALRRGHEALATQMAENLRVLATARSVTETILSDVAKQVGAGTKPKTYGATGKAQDSQSASFNGISINRAL